MNIVWWYLVVIAFAGRCCQGALEPMVHQCVNDIVSSDSRWSGIDQYIELLNYVQCNIDAYTIHVCSYCIA